LVETKVKEHKFHHITRCLPHNWSFSNNYMYSLRGRMRVAWDMSVWDCNVISTSA